mmetsp:Transcript_6734/g.16431  ORF Transcript_6734/g.16431 Transcript_6734/m.16431 type:complete len:120 (+) Transcript_6734:102-461(+)
MLCCAERLHRMCSLGASDQTREPRADSVVQGVGYNASIPFICLASPGGCSAMPNCHGAPFDVMPFKATLQTALSKLRAENHAAVSEPSTNSSTGPVARVPWGKSTPCGVGSVDSTKVLG